MRRREIWGDERREGRSHTVEHNGKEGGEYQLKHNQSFHEKYAFLSSKKSSSVKIGT